MRVKKSLAPLVAVWVLSSCAVTPSSPSDAAVQVRERAEQRWQYLVAGRLDEAYGYLSPGSRERVTAAYYKGSLKPGVWRGARVTGVECELDACKVQVALKYEYMRPGVKYESERALDETWIREDGQWWYVLPP